MPSELIDLRRMLHVSRFNAWRNIYIPSVLTAFVTGSITSIGAAWNALIVAEYFAGSNTREPLNDNDSDKQW